MPFPPAHPSRGSALFIILVAIALLGALTWAVSYSTEQQTAAPDNLEVGEQIARLLAQGATLAGAVGHMASIGDQDPVALSGTGVNKLNTVIPGGPGWDTPPHATKIYHPLGGGVKYIAQTGTGTVLSPTKNVANDFKINASTWIDGVGPTNTGGDFLFTARVASLAACQKINAIVRGTPANAPPMAMLPSYFDDLFVNGLHLDIDENVCADCPGVARGCVDNATGDAWGYYQALLPQ